MNLASVNSLTELLNSFFQVFAHSDGDEGCHMQQQLYLVQTSLESEVGIIIQRKLTLRHPNILESHDITNTQGWIQTSATSFQKLVRIVKK